ncbi:hypothetical protein FOL47_011133 [Perkinsus chesapeaki]|uniref:Tyr recombinase domain-containing protein n=1 Tax=Perkinsus chesapeaki TaxID=330153 RepID=A0A7J6KZN1_PERCH|nr:hypothetical protein FOL47_011133 [Perkinsus chesapeaki]
MQNSGWAPLRSLSWQPLGVPSVSSPRVPVKSSVSSKAQQAVVAASTSDDNQLKSFVASAFAESTHKQMRSASVLYESICGSKNHDPYPVNLDKLLLMVHAMTQASYSVGTIQKYISQIRSQASRSRLLILDEVDSSIVTLSLRAAKKVLGSAVTHATTLSREDVFSVSSVLRRTCPEAADLYLLGVSGLFRLGELLQMEAGHINPCWLPTGSGEMFGISVFVKKSKTDVFSRGCYRNIACISESGDSFSCSSAFCSAHSILIRSRSAVSPDDPLFRVTRDAFSGLLRQAIVEVCGVTQSGSPTSHSMRRSGAVMCFQGGMPLTLLAEYGRWSSTECLDKIYLRDGPHSQQLFSAYVLRAWTK